MIKFVIDCNFTTFCNKFSNFTTIGAAAPIPPWKAAWKPFGGQVSPRTTILATPLKLVKCLPLDQNKSISSLRTIGIAKDFEEFIFVCYSNFLKMQQKGIQKFIIMLD